MPQETETKLEFMRKARFESIRSKFSNITDEARENIEKAKDNDILKLDLTFNSPVSVQKAEVVTKEQFLDLAF